MKISALSAPRGAVALAYAKAWLRHSPRLIAALAVLAFVLIADTAHLAYELGRQTGATVHWRNDQLAALAVRLTVRPVAPVTAPAEPAPPAVAPQAPVALPVFEPAPIVAPCLTRHAKPTPCEQPAPHKPPSPHGSVAAAARSGASCPPPPLLPNATTTQPQPNTPTARAPQGAPLKPQPAPRQGRPAVNRCPMRTAT